MQQLLSIRPNSFMNLLASLPFFLAAKTAVNFCHYSLIDSCRWNLLLLFSLSVLIKTKPNSEAYLLLQNRSGGGSPWRFHGVLCIKITWLVLPKMGQSAKGSLIYWPKLNWTYLYQLKWILRFYKKWNNISYKKNALVVSFRVCETK